MKVDLHFGSSLLFLNSIKSSIYAVIIHVSEKWLLHDITWTNLFYRLYHSFTVARTPIPSHLFVYFSNRFILFYHNNSILGVNYCVLDNEKLVTFWDTVETLG